MTARVPAISTAYDSVYVSPHRDDVALACPGRLVREHASGQRVLLVTLFASGPHAAADSGGDALAGLGVEHLALDLPDARQRDAAVAPLSDRLRPRGAQDEDVLHQAADVLTDLAHRTRARQVYAPLAVGGHIDHRVAHEAARAAFTAGNGRNVFLYEERPEAFVPGAVRIRLTRASVRFEDGFALVRMGGLASLADRAEEQASAEIDVAGGLDVVELDPRTGRLRGQVRLIALDARRVDLLGVRAPGEAERLIEDLGRERLEAFGELISQLEIPVRVEQELTLPAVQAEGVRIEAAVIPIRASVLDVEAFRGRLWVSISAGIEAPPAGERK